MATAARLQASAQTYRELCYQRNRGSILFFELVWGMGSPFLAFTVLLPDLLNSLHIKHSFIGLVPAAQTGAWLILQPWSAYAFRPGPRRLLKMSLLYSLGTCGFLLLGLLTCNGIVTPWIILLAAILAVGGMAFGTGIADPQYLSIMVDAVPDHQRGRYFGLRLLFAGIGGILGGVLCRFVLRLAPEPRNFGFAFITGALFIILSTFGLRLYRDNPEPGAERAANFRSFLRARIMPLLTDMRYRWFLLAVACFGFAVSVFPFLATHIKTKLHAQDAFLGKLVIVSMACSIVMPTLLGSVCDRWGLRRGYVVSTALYLLGLVGCVVGHERNLLVASYFLATLYQPINVVVITNLALKLAPDSTPPEVIAAKMIAMSSIQIIAPIAIGAMIDAWSMGAAVAACTLCILVSIGLLMKCAPLSMSKAIA